MKPSKLCKLAGLKSLDELAEISNTQAQTLRNWSVKNPQLFEVVLKGAAVKKLEIVCRK